MKRRVWMGLAVLTVALAGGLWFAMTRAEYGFLQEHKPLALHADDHASFRTMNLEVKFYSFEADTRAFPSGCKSGTAEQRLRRGQSSCGRLRLGHFLRPK